MKRILKKSVIRFLKDEEGVTAVECALMLALVVVVCLVALNPIAKAKVEPVSDQYVAVEIIN